MSNRRYLSANLQWLIKKNNLTNAELARRCNLAQPVLYRLVTGLIENPQINTLLPIADYFNCSLTHLVTKNLAQNSHFLNIKTEIFDIRHKMRNAMAILNASITGMQKILPALIDCYHTLPQELRAAEIPPDALKMLPKVIENAIQTLSDLKNDINQFKENT